MESTGMVFSVVRRRTPHRASSRRSARRPSTASAAMSESCAPAARSSSRHASPRRCCPHCGMLAAGLCALSDAVDRAVVAGGAEERLAWNRRIAFGPPAETSTPTSEDEVQIPRGVHGPHAQFSTPSSSSKKTVVQSAGCLRHDPYLSPCD
jgi:hypothetical protein